jgi:hypothetical protein
MLNVVWLISQITESIGKNKMKKLDINLNKQKNLKAIRSIYFGGEALRKIEIWNNGAGEPETVRVIYSGRETKKC